MDVEADKLADAALTGEKLEEAEIAVAVVAVAAAGWEN